MSQRERLLEAMEQDLHQDLDDYVYLRGLMQELRHGLMRCDTDGVQLLNERIQLLLGSAQDRARRRVKVLKAVGLAFDEAGMQAFIALYPTARGRDMQALWTQLGQIAQQCQRLNEVNGQLLASQHEILCQLLEPQRGDGFYSPPAY